MKIEKTYCDICGKEVGLSVPLKTIKHTKKSYLYRNLRQ